MTVFPRTLSEPEKKLLALMNENNKFAIQVGLALDEPVQMALEEMQRWREVTLIDVTYVAAAGFGKLMRVFLVDHRIAELYRAGERKAS